MQENNPSPKESSNDLNGESNSKAPEPSKRQSFKVKSSVVKATEVTAKIQPKSSSAESKVSPSRITTNIVAEPPSSSLEQDENNLHELKSLRGKRPGDRYIRMNKNSLESAFKQENLRYQVEQDTAPLTSIGRLWRRTKRILIGRPLPTSVAQHQRLSKITALAVLSSDALSSTAYATEEILLALVLAGTASLYLSLPIAFVIACLLIIVALSYRQTIAAYPNGGGAYIVAKDNMGLTPGLIAASSLQINYILTVAVSISAGVAAITSAFPVLTDLKIEICLFLIAFIVIANLRGIRESGAIFTAPTYLFIISMAILFLLGFLKILFGWNIGGDYTPEPIPTAEHVEELTLFLVLRAFSSGCAALTGVEAISDGVPAFKPPEAKNARTTLSWMAGILVVLFLFITFLSNYFKIVPIEPGSPRYETVISQIAHAIVGNNAFYYVVQFTTALILILGANTAFSDFPRLSWFLARDKYLPHLFSHQGDRLAFSTGIIALGGVAAVLVVIFGGDTNALIPLYAVGVFTGFTLSQAGMVVRWWKLRTPGWRKSLALNGLGCISTGVVLVIIGVTKFMLGAWMVIVLIPILYLIYRVINRHYSRVEKEVELEDIHQIPTLVTGHQAVIVPVNGLNQVSLRTLSYAKTHSDDVTAIFASDNSDKIDQLREKWAEAGLDIPLVGLETQYRAVIGPILFYIDDLRRHNPDQTITVVIPEFVTAKWWQRLLHNQTAFRLKASLFLRPGVVIISVPYHLEKEGTRTVVK